MHGAYRGLWERSCGDSENADGSSLLAGQPFRQGTQLFPFKKIIVASIYSLFLWCLGRGVRPHKIRILGPRENRRDLVGTPGHSGQPTDQRKNPHIKLYKLAVIFMPRSFKIAHANIMTAIFTYPLITGQTNGPLPRLRYGQHQGRWGAANPPKHWVEPSVQEGI